MEEICKTGEIQKDKKVMKAFGAKMIMVTKQKENSMLLMLCADTCAGR